MLIRQRLISTKLIPSILNTKIIQSISYLMSLLATLAMIMPTMVMSSRGTMRQQARCWAVKPLSPS
jgi:hypothetical protein